MTFASSPDLRARFLAGMARAATTVSVVATDGPAGRFGLTVSAMTSVAADGDDGYPTLLVCIHQASPVARAIADNGAFSVNVLGDDQSDLSDRFAGRITVPGGDRFAGIALAEGVTGCPRLVHARATFDCRVASATLVGTHHIFIGAVAAVHVGTEAGLPLVYSERTYCRPAPLAA